MGYDCSVTPSTSTGWRLSSAISGWVDSQCVECVGPVQLPDGYASNSAQCACQVCNWQRSVGDSNRTTASVCWHAAQSAQARDVVGGPGVQVHDPSVCAGGPRTSVISPLANERAW